MGPRRAFKLIKSFGSALAVLRAERTQLENCEGIGRRLADSLISWREDTSWEEELALAHQHHVDIVTPVDDDYPARLREIPDAPLVLYRKGPIGARDNHSLAVVGSRAASPYGLAVARKLARHAATVGMPVVSGLALGIDTAAHEGALDGGGRTIAVLGGGLLCLYPKENTQLAQRIVDHGGCLYSEFPLRRAPDKQSFAIRNRIVAGLCKATLVVEAPPRSGALITATMAREMGRLVMAVPGRVDTPHASGCHQLIKNGARLVESFEDIIDCYGELFASKSSETFETPSVNQNNDSKDEQKHLQPTLNTGIQETMSEAERNILKLLTLEELSAEELANRLLMPAHQLNVALTKLELRRLIKPQIDGTFRATIK